MAKKKHAHTKESLVMLCLEMAESRSWSSLSLRDIAAQADISLAALCEMFEDKDDILCALGRMIDRKTLENFDAPEANISPRDAVFDIMMERFDVLNEFRAGIVAILTSIKYDPKQALLSFPHLCKSMNWMLEAAHIDTEGFRGALKIAGLAGIYLNVLRSWMQDDTPDMSQTMAALDKDLGRAEQFINMLSL